jgi:DNA-binding response OmpR family regulator
MPHRTKRILLVEDEPSLIFTLQDTLESEGFQVHVVVDGLNVMDAVKQVQPDLMILDVMLPGRSGFDVCRDVRDAKHTFPILMLTAREEEIDKVKGLLQGADDYITKPFGVKELLARIAANLRRANTYTEEGPFEVVTFGPVTIDLVESTVNQPNGTFDLSNREVELLRFLLAHANQPVSRDKLLQHVWRYEHSTNTRTVDVHVSKLRTKLEPVPEDPRYLVTLHGIGYMLKLT